MPVPRDSNIPGVSPPPVLIFFHIPKTGGSTFEAVLSRGLADEYFDINFFSEECPDSCLWVYSTPRIAKKFDDRNVSPCNVRCMGGDHVSLDVQSLFDQPSKFVTILRNPVDRALSHFFHLRSWSVPPCYPFVKDMTVDQYLDSGIGLDFDNQQVRMLSGCRELDAPWDPDGGPVSTPPVERIHLDMAKRNIEERFIAAATLEQFDSLVWFVKRLYGFPLHRTLFRPINKGESRAKPEVVSGATRKRLETLNQYDIELYQWAKERFARQIETLGPHFSNEVRRYEWCNRIFQKIADKAPHGAYSTALNLFRLRAVRT